MREYIKDSVISLRSVIVALVIIFSASAHRAEAADPVPTPVNPAHSYIENFSRLVADKISETMPVGLFGLNIKPSASLWLPVWRFHADGNAAVEYFNLGVGGEWSKDLNGGEAYAGGMVNIVAISGRLWNFDWARRHVSRSQFPDILAGPSLGLPFDANKIQETFSSGEEFLKRGRIMVGVRF